MDPESKHTSGVASQDSFVQNASRNRRVGADRLHRQTDGRVVIESRVEMPDWRASRFRPTAVFIEGERFAVCAHHPLKRGNHRYELAPWPEDQGVRPGLLIEYGEDYVRRRDKLRSAVRTTGVLAALAIPFTPLLGFLPARIKTALHGVIGVHPVSATRASLALECLAAIVIGAMGVIHVMTLGQMTPEFGDTMWLFPLLLIDAFMRYNSVLSENIHALGFLEWLVPASLRRPRSSGDAQGVDGPSAAARMGVIASVRRSASGRDASGDP
jgi:hypothetical protein